MSLLNVLVFAFETIVANGWQRAIALMTVESIIAPMNVCTIIIQMKSLNRCMRVVKVLHIIQHGMKKIND